MANCLDDVLVDFRRNREQEEFILNVYIGVWFWSGFFMTLAWWHNVFVCYKASAWLTLILESFIFPLGVVNGLSNWIGIV